MDQTRFNNILTSIVKKGEDYVDCSSLGLDDAKLNTLIAALESSPVPVKSLNVTDNHITSVGAAALAEFLKQTTINEIYMSGNKIDGSGITTFLPLFAQDSHPTVFDVRGNPCSETLIVRVTFLAKSGPFNDTIKAALLHAKAEEVSFVGMRYSDIDIRLIRFLLLEVEGLKSVDFSDTAAGDAGAWAIGQIIKDSKVRSVTMRKCTIGVVGLNNFIEACDLPHHQYLKSLDFCDNISISNEIGKRIPTVVFDTNNCITNFDLRETSMTTDIRAAIEEECALNMEPRSLKDTVVAIRRGAPESADIKLQWEKNMTQCMRFMWRYIRASKVVERLNISNSLIDDEAIGLLVRALETNTTLRVLELANNKITAIGVTALFEIIQKGKCGIQEVNLANNNLGDDSASPIITALRVNPKLKIVNVDVNPLLSSDYVDEIGGLSQINHSPAVIRALLPALEKNSKEITVIDFSGPETCVNDDSVRLLCQALSLNTSVRRVDLSNNVIGDIGAVYLAELLASNCPLTELRLVKNSIGNRGAQKLCDALRVNKSLKVLDISNNVFGSEGVDGYASMLRANHFIREITLLHTRVPAETGVLIQRACDLNREPPEVKGVYYRLQDADETLVHLDLSEKQRQWALDDQTMKTLCAELRGRNFVTSVDLSGNSITAGGCQQLVGVLSHENCAITKLNLARNPIDDSGLAELTKTFSVNKSITDIDIRWTAITNHGAGIAAEALKENDTILSILVSEELDGVGVALMKHWLTINNQARGLKSVVLQLENGEQLEMIDLHHQKDREFGDVACQILCGLLVKNKALTTLNLSRNKITAASSPYLTEVMEECPKLTYVDISRNEIDDRGAKQFISVIEVIPHIRTVKVKGNPMSGENQERIAQLLTMNLSSQKLKKVLLQHSRGEKLDGKLDFNGKTNNYRLSDEEATLLAQVLADTTDVLALDLGNNDITDRGCIAIAEVLRVNHSMQALYLDHNSIETDGGEALFYALKINPQLHTLNLEDTRVPEPILEDILSLLHVNQTGLKERIDMRATTVDQLDDAIQFKCTDYYSSQQEKLEVEALEVCKRTEQLLLE